MRADWTEGLEGILGDGRTFGGDDLDGVLAGRTDAAAEDIEESFAEAGWYTNEAEPYWPPGLEFGASSEGPTTVDAVRRLWMVRYNPDSVQTKGFSNSDVDDDAAFPWSHPEDAPYDGWWLDTRWMGVRRALEWLSPGDLVVCQRTDPKGEQPKRGRPLIGICTVDVIDRWHDAATGRAEAAACLLPLARFTHEVPRDTAVRHGRMKGRAFANPYQQPGGGGGLGFTLSVVEGAEAVELLSVCGIPPEALAEANTATLAARLRATDTGNPRFLHLRYDTVLLNDLRREHERKAERQAQAWAEANSYALRACHQRVANAGYDLLFIDATGQELQVEVKGYMAANLVSVHLQPSQARRAHEAAAGVPPDWRLFAVLGTDTASERELLLKPDEVVELIATGGLQVAGGWPQPTPAA